MNNISSTLATVWRIAAPYFRSEYKWAGRGLLAAVITIELALVALDVLLNQWQNRFYNALQEKNWDNFVREMGIFCILATCIIALAVYQLYLNQWLQIRWRRWMTARYLGDWLHDAGTVPTVGKRGLGGLAVSADGRTLYAVNLATRELVEIPVAQSLRPQPTIAVFGNEDERWEILVFAEMS